MPGLVKIGFSTKDPLLRASELANTGAPHPYEVEYDALVDSPRELEAKLHRALSHQREGREWFRVPVQATIQAIREHSPAIYVERHLSAAASAPTFLDAGTCLGLMEPVARRCDYTPDCDRVPTRKYHQMAFCEEHYKTYILGRAASRRRVGPGKGPG